MDKVKIAQRFANACKSYNQEAVAQYRIACHLSELMKKFVPLSPKSVLEIGCGTGQFSRLMLKQLRPKQALLNDLCPEMQPELADILSTGVSFYPGDAEHLSLPTNQQLIASCSAVQWFTNIPLFLEKCYTVLAANGFLVFSTFGPDNMKEIKSLTGMALSYYSLEKWKQWLSPNYDLIHSEEEQIVLTFDNPVKVLYHLKQTGVTGISSNTPWTKGKLDIFNQQYQEKYSTKDGKVQLTYHPIYFIVKKQIK